MPHDRYGFQKRNLEINPPNKGHIMHLPGYCSSPGCDRPAGRTGRCGTCLEIERDKEKRKNRPKKEPMRLQKSFTPIKKIGDKNKFFCSDGEVVTETVIHDRYKRSYRRQDKGTVSRRCEGCGSLCTGHAHIIAKARCKILRKTELIWDERNFFPACNHCNMAIENPKGKDWKRLLNKDYCINFIKEHDPELYTKFEYAQTETL